MIPKIWYLAAPTSPHVIVASNRLTITHETKVHCWSYEIAIKGQVHSTHGKQSALWDGQNSIHIPNKNHNIHDQTHLQFSIFLTFQKVTRVEVVPSVPLKRLHKLSRSIVVWDVEPKTMRNCSWHTFAETEGVTTNKICTFSERFVESVEKEWCGWAEKVLYMLLKCINLMPRWIGGNLSHIKDNKS